MSGRLRSVNVGRPREIEWQGKIVRTAIWKEPVDGPRMVRRINIDGDEQADRLAHGGEHRAAFVYQLDSYRYWKRELGRSDFTYGQFGENFTVEGVADDAVCIGDRYRIGEALFEVTQPRVTCYLRVAEIRRESASISSLRLEPADDAAAAPNAQAGQYLTVRVRPDDDAPPVTRSYSLSDVPDERGYRISVKREGAASRYLHQRVKVGDLLDAAAPRGSFVLRDGTRPVVLISAGVGATPVLAMLHALARQHSTRPVWWVHGARNRDEHAFGAEVDALLGGLANGHRVLAYSRPGGGETLGSDYDVSGRLDLAVLDREAVPTDADHYLCGPDGFMRAIGAALTARGVEPQHIATETFGAVAVYASGLVKAGDRAPHPPEGPPGTGPTVTFVRSNLALPWDDRYPSLLDLAEACDVPVGFGCRHGVCHDCESGLVAGAVTYHTEPLEPPPDGRILVCCSRPASELALDL
jgi:ferredoxin-NADP reductase